MCHSEPLSDPSEVAAEPSHLHGSESAHSRSGGSLSAANRRDDLDAQSEDAWRLWNEGVEDIQR